MSADVFGCPQRWMSSRVCMKARVCRCGCINIVMPVVKSYGQCELV